MFFCFFFSILNIFPSSSTSAKSGAPYLTCSQSSDSRYLAVGAEIYHHETYIDIYDLQTLTLIKTYSESHSDDITSLSFHPSLPHILLSSSVDGLINLYDVRIEDEDDALVSTAQVGASLSDAGWMELDRSKGQMKGVWGTTTIETIQFWALEEVSLFRVPYLFYFLDFSLTFICVSRSYCRT